MATASKEEWTKAHEDALSGLVGLGLGKKYSRDLLEGMPAGNLSDMMNAALRSHAKSKKLVPIEGGPKGAAPITPPAAPSPSPAVATPPAAPFSPTRPSMPSAPMQIGPEQIQQAEAARQEAIRRASSGWGSLIPQAPIGPAAAQLQPTAAPAAAAPTPTPTEKPRVRVRATGHYVPPAPLGGEAPSTETPSPTKAPQTPSPAQETPTKQQLPRIRTEEELAKLEAGTEFVWIPDGHIYRKNEAQK